MIIRNSPYIFLIFCFVSFALAQDNCPTFVSYALNTVDSACTDIARNQLCYGNITLNVTPRIAINDLHFNQSGDLANLADIEKIQLSPFDTATDEWGIALMSVQANLPDTLPGQNVSFLLFGDVSIADASSDIIEVPLTAMTGVNVRAHPNTTATVVGSLRNGQSVTAIGRLADSSWVRIRLENDSLGWVASSYLDGEVYQLLQTDGTDFGPMQAFYFSTGIGHAACAEAPDSGILIQTPEGVDTVILRANNVEIELGSTIYIQAIAGDAMIVNVIEGEAIITSFGETQVVPAGTFSSIPLDANGLASGIPEYPQAYDESALQNLPIDHGLERDIILHSALTETQITNEIDIANGLPPLTGNWSYTDTVIQTDCLEGNHPAVGATANYTSTITFNASRSTMHLVASNMYDVTLYRVNRSTFYTGQRRVALWQLNFTSPTTFTGTWDTWPTDPECGLVLEFEGVYQH